MFLRKRSRVDNAKLLRYIGPNFPLLRYWENPAGSTLPQGWVDVFGLIRDSCPNLKTVRISTGYSDSAFPLNIVDAIPAHMLRLLDDGDLKDMASLEKINVTHWEPEYHLSKKEMEAEGTVLRSMLPRDKRAFEFFWLPGFDQADQGDKVMEEAKRVT